MSNKKSVLIIGIDPKCLNFSIPEFVAANITAEKVFNGIMGSANALNEKGYYAEVCWIDLGETAIEVIKTHLQPRNFDCVLIGAGIRKVDANFNLFENIINAVHEYAPSARICFNSNPMDTVESVQRWV